MGKLSSAVALVVASAVGCGGGSDDDATLFLAADEVGPDPFTADVAEPVPVEFVELSDDFGDAADEAEQAVLDDLADEQSVDVDEVVIDQAALRQARIDAAVSTADANGVPVELPGGSGGVALYGGSGVNACDVEAMIEFLEADPDLGEAWASVQGIDRTELRDYIESLTPGFLLLDTTVINHGFKNGEVTSNEAVLEAGTAVLVDDHGNVRARCRCGNPQLPATAADVSGLWIARGYQCPTDIDGRLEREIVRVEVDGDRVTATKVSGDDCVDDGEVTFAGTWSGTEWLVEGRCAGPGGRPSPCRSGTPLLVRDVDYFEWNGIGFSRCTDHSRCSDR